MCTLVVDLSPERPCAVAVAAVRDEFLGRPWQPPARHWPDRPGLIGGRDELAGGTWLAYDPAAGRVACVLNASGRPADPAHRRSRGALPLLSAAGADLPDPVGYDPFHLVTADVTGLRVLTWNGYQPHAYRLGAGTHVFANRGRWLGPADRRTPRASWFGPRFAAARPDPTPDVDVAAAWAPWIGLIDGADVPRREDPRALVASATVGESRWGTSSVTLLGFGPHGPGRYDFRPGPDPHPWTAVAT